MMNEIQQDESVAKERLVADQSARELAPLLSVNERALVSILATSELYDLDAKKLIKSYADELGSSSAKELAAQLRPGIHPLDAASQIRGLMPKPCEVALNSSRASGSLKAFCRSWLAQSVDDRSSWVRHEHTNAAILGRLGIRTLVCTWILSFIIWFIIPEHQMMFEEFGIEMSQTMVTFMMVCDRIAKLLPIFLFFVFCIFLYVLIFQRSIMKNYIRRWLPGQWRQKSLPKTILHRKLLAWDLLAFRGNNQLVNEPTDWDGMVRSRTISTSEANVMKGVTSRETQAWLLRNMADRRHQQRTGRFSLGVNVFSVLFQLALAAIIVLATFSMFSMIIQLMEGIA